MIQVLMAVGLTNESHCSQKDHDRMHLGAVFSGGGEGQGTASESQQHDFSMTNSICYCSELVLIKLKS